METVIQTTMAAAMVMAVIMAGVTILITVSSNLVVKHKLFNQAIPECNMKNIGLVGYHWHN